MLGDLGAIFAALALLATLYGSGAAYVSIRRDDRRWWESARNALIGAAVLLGLALLVLVAAFLTHDFAVRYVVLHASRAMPAYLKVSAVWAGQEGSLLVWTFFQASFTALAISLPSQRARPLVPWTTVVLGVIGAFFLGITLFLSNPFVQLSHAPLDGQGMNPLLRHPGMVFHPPAMFVGYVGLSIPFAFALAALIAHREVRWTQAVRTWTLIAWIGLSLGLFLGMRWAYDVLGWGGYWGWDPVENAGLLPWFTTTALLHSAVMRDEGRGFEIWNYVLVALSFVLVLFGTFATRSGVIQSVHAFAESNLGGWFLGAIGVSLAVSLGLIFRHRAELSARAMSDRLFSRDGLFFLTLVVLCTLTVSVFVGSVLPTITDLLTAQRFDAGPDWFDRVTGPQFGALLLLMGICPLLGRSTSVFRRVKRWGWLVGLGAGSAVVAALLAGLTKPAVLVAFALTGIAGTTALVEIGDGVARRMRRTQSPVLNVLWELLRLQRRRYGGYLVHLGVVLMAVGVIGTRFYPFERNVVLTPGEPHEVAGYTLVTDPLSQEIVRDALTTSATVTVYRDGDYLSTLVPRVNRYEGYQQLYTVPALRPALSEDLYLLLAGWSGDGTEVTFKVVVNVLVNFLWLGGLVFFAGGAVALWPREMQAPWNAIAAVTVGLLLVASGWSMWGASHGMVRRSTGRPMVGHTAPDFRLTTLDGKTAALTDLQGRIVVLNFWAPWCPSCKDDLPVLQQLWEDYRDRGVVFVGAAYDTEVGAARESIATHGLTFPVGLDTGNQLADAYGITGVPETFVIDAAGHIAVVHIGPLPEGQLKMQLERLLEAE